VNDELPNTQQSLIGRVRSMVYLVDEPATTLTIQIDSQTITARAYGAVALDLRALPRGATISVELIAQAEQDYPQITTFTVIPC
jgi:uncharacterized lipoprotein YbaY